MASLKVNGLPVSYAANADIAARPGIPVLFVHGAGGSKHTWKQQLNPRIEGYFQVALDLPGHADSGGTGAASVGEYRDFIRDFADAAGLDGLVIAGHSMGGAIAQACALAFGDRLHGLILVGTGARLRVARNVLESARQGKHLSQFAYSAKTEASLIEEAEQDFALTPPEVRYRDYLACDSFDIMDEVEAITRPALIICGEDDVLTPVKYSRYLHEKISGSVLHVVPDAGHMVMWEQAERVNDQLGAFLERL